MALPFSHTHGKIQLDPGHKSGSTDDMEMKVELVGSDPHGRVRTGTLTVTVPVQPLPTYDNSYFEDWGIGSVCKRQRGPFGNATTKSLTKHSSDMTMCRLRSWIFAVLQPFDEALETADGPQALLFVRQSGMEELKKQGHSNSFSVLFLLPIGINNDDGMYRRVDMGHLVMNWPLGWSRDRESRSFW